MFLKCQTRQNESTELFVDMRKKFCAVCTELQFNNFIFMCVAMGKYNKIKIC